MGAEQVGIRHTAMISYRICLKGPALAPFARNVE